MGYAFATSAPHTQKSRTLQRKTGGTLEPMGLPRFELGAIPQPQGSAVDPAGNLLAHGDAEHVMSTLLDDPGLGLAAGDVSLCYIDPPYNTGETFSHYTDNRTTQDWLSILQRHLRLVHRLLSPTGSVWVHLDDTQQHRARCILDEVFGEESFVATVIWQKRTSRDNRKAFTTAHDYIHVYSPAGPKIWKTIRNGLPDDGAFINPDNDPIGPWRSVPMTAQARHGTESQFYTVTTPTGVKHDPPKGRCWTYTAHRLTELDAAGRVYWPRNGDGKPRLKRYAYEITGLSPFTIWTAAEVGDSTSAKKDLLKDFPDGQIFDTPKPVGLLERIVNIATNPGDIVLDHYLGSGTTAVAAQKLGRRWVGIEENFSTIESFAAPRILSAHKQNPTLGVRFASYRP